MPWRRRRRRQWKRRWKKWICVLSNLVTFIWTRSKCQMQATFPRRCRSCLIKLPIATDYSDQRNLTCQAKINYGPVNCLFLYIFTYHSKVWKLKLYVMIREYDDHTIPSARRNITLQTRHLPWRSLLNVCKCSSLNSEKCALVSTVVLKNSPFKFHKHFVLYSL